MGFRIGRKGASHSYPEPRFVPASGGSSSGPKILAVNVGGDVTVSSLDSSHPDVLATLGPVTVVAGQILIVDVSCEYAAVSNNGAQSQTIGDVAVEVGTLIGFTPGPGLNWDEIDDTIPIIGQTGVNPQFMKRSVERHYVANIAIGGDLDPGTYTVSFSAYLTQTPSVNASCSAVSATMSAEIWTP